MHYINPKVTYAGKTIKMENEQTEGVITVVKSFRVYPEEKRKIPTKKYPKFKKRHKLLKRHLLIWIF